VRAVLVVFIFAALVEGARGETMGILLIRNTDDAARVTQSCQRAKGLKVTKNPRNYAKPHSRRYRLTAHQRWHNRRRACQTYLRYPPHYQQWLCIHSHEGSWQDAWDPYWGGLQMDRSFMRSYAPKHLLRRGWANTWTPIEQMWVAENAYRTRGFNPWPNTARMCGLL
jgi:hypothetical protein